MNATVLSHSQELYALVAAKSKESPAISILDLGCSDGLFVSLLGQQGYNAEGIDGDGEVISIRSDVLKLHQGELTALEDVFGDRKFDLITAQGVFCMASQINYMTGDILDLTFILSIMHSDAINTAAQENIRKILASAYGQLMPGGYLVIIEDGGDSVDFERKTAEVIGYAVEKLGKQEAILQKPFKEGTT